MNVIIRGGSKIAVGSIAGFALALAIAPVLTRLYSPETFGAFGILIAAASTFIGFSTARLEVLGLPAQKDAHFAGLAWQGLRFTLVVGATLSLVGSFFAIRAGQPHWMTVGILIVVGSLQLTGSAAYARERSYGHIAASNFTQQGGMPVTQAALGATGSIWGLLAGFILPRLVWLRPSLGLRSGDTNVDIPWGQALPASLAALLNSLATQFPILIVGIFYGISGSGFLALAQRIFTAPLQILSTTLAAASTAEISALLRQQDIDGARNLIWHTMKVLALFALPPILIAAALAPLLASSILGPEWSAVGLMVSALAVGAYAQFIAAPFAQVLNLTGHSRRLMFWDLGRAIVALCAVAGAGVAGLPITVALLIFSAGMACMYALLVVLLSNSLVSCVVYTGAAS